MKNDKVTVKAAFIHEKKSHEPSKFHYTQPAAGMVR